MRNFIITVNGKSYNVGVEEVTASEGVTPVVTEIKETATKVSEGAGTKVSSPFPGLVKKLLVADGAKVKKDQPILVLEAMKMDNDVTAPCDGVITFSVSKGTNVESNGVLAYIS